MVDLYFSHYTLSVTLLLSILLTGCNALNNPPSSTSHDGLELVSTKPLDSVYRKPDSNLGGYQHLIVGDCSVAFRKNWQRDHNAASRSSLRWVSDDEVASTKSKLAELCREVFIEELQRDGIYTIVDASAEGVLELRPSIVDLDINAPDSMTPGRSSSYTTSFGSMRLYLEIYDSVSGEILARVSDKRSAPDKGQLEWTNALTNMQDAKRILRYWGKMLRQLMDSSNSSG